MGFEPAPLQTGALSQGLRPLGHCVLAYGPQKYHYSQPLPTTSNIKLVSTSYLQLVSDDLHRTTDNFLRCAYFLLLATYYFVLTGEEKRETERTEERGQRGEGRADGKESGARREAAFQTNILGRIAQLGDSQTEDLKVSGSIPDPATLLWWELPTSGGRLAPRTCFREAFGPMQVCVLP